MPAQGLGRGVGTLLLLMLNPANRVGSGGKSSQDEALLSFLQVDLKFPPSVPLGAQDLIYKLLKHNPSERLPLAQVSAHPWVRTHSRRVLPPSAPQSVP